MRIQFLGLWIEWSERPFLKDNHNKSGAKPLVNSIFKEMMKKTHLICKNKKTKKSFKKLLGEITISTETLWDQLFRPRFANEDLNLKVLEYLDEKMKKVHGSDDSKWTSKQARNIKDALLNELYGIIGEKPEDPHMDTDAEDSGGED